MSSQSEFSDGHTVLSPLLHLFIDVQTAFPGLYAIGDRDELMDRAIRSVDPFLNLVRTRGLRVLTIDLVEAGKYFDNLLADSGRRGNPKAWEDLPYPLNHLVKKSELLRDMWFLCKSDCFAYPASTEECTDEPAKSVFFVRQVLCLYKKTKADPTPEGVDDSLRQFKRIESSLRRPDYFGRRSDFGGVNSCRFADCYESHRRDLFGHQGHLVPKPLVDCLDQVAGIVSSQFPTLDPYTLIPRHGPGAVADLQTGKDKFSFPNWPAKLQDVFPSGYFVYSAGDLDQSRHNKVMANHELPARLLAVPKTMKGPRLITAEPTANQFLQQGILRWFRENLPTCLRRSIDFRSQAPSRDQAMVSSRTGTMATVDLSSASDRMSCWTIERLFRSNVTVLTALDASRTCWLKNATGEGEMFYLRLRKFAGQGSAVTFPIQSILYAVCCYAVLLYERGLKVNSRNIQRVAGDVRVFGDDIILPSSSTWNLALLLEYLELKVNGDKTHSVGHFRESCGMDAYKGHDVTPVYLRALTLGQRPKAEELVSWVDVSNNAHLAGLWSLAGWMVDQIPTSCRRLIPISQDPQLGSLRLCTFSTGTSAYRQRYDDDVQRAKYLILTVQSREVRARRNSADDLLEFFLSRPDTEDRLRYLEPTKSELGYITGNRLWLQKRWV